MLQVPGKRSTFSFNSLYVIEVPSKTAATFPGSFLTASSNTRESVTRGARSERGRSGGQCLK
jgi:hypothetical protein